jgi:hypothetical protein
VDSIATERIPQDWSQSASSCRSLVKVGKLRTGLDRDQRGLLQTVRWRLHRYPQHRDATPADLALFPAFGGHNILPFLPDGRPRSERKQTPLIPSGTECSLWLFKPGLATIPARPGSRSKYGRCGLAASSLAGQNGKCSRSDNSQGSPDVRAQPPRKRLPAPVP